MSPVHLRNLGIPRQKPEDREGLSRTRIPGKGHLGQSSGWQETEGNQTQSSIHLPVQQRPQTRGLEGYGLSSSAPPTPQRSFPMEHRQKEVKPSIPLGRNWSKFPEDTSQRDTLQRPYCHHQRLESHQEERATRIRKNQATILAIEEQLNQTGPTLIPSGSQGVDQPNTPVASCH
ncbi:hypothetical protein O181_021086 [Austropuccinia psidii MF-1]|uniref:Uncharacterized protein n=1 Tax=Austropuccinia psidii MF-1 TaxID=1389203 RepID=A0A9Q3CES1_9BASI|nr:hypothetical protein [Austropuccinia psidii MF-1]